MLAPRSWLPACKCAIEHISASWEGAALCVQNSLLFGMAKLLGNFTPAQQPSGNSKSSGRERQLRHATTAMPPKNPRIPPDPWRAFENAEENRLLYLGLVSASRSSLISTAGISYTGGIRSCGGGSGAQCWLAGTRGGGGERAGELAVITSLPHSNSQTWPTWTPWACRGRAEKRPLGPAKVRRDLGTTQ